MKYFWYGMAICVGCGCITSVIKGWLRHRRNVETWNQIIDGMVDNLHLLHEETGKLAEDWNRWTLDERKKALFDVILGERLKDDSNHERSKAMADWTLELHTQDNPTLAWNQHIYAIMIHRRMELAKRAVRKAKQAK
jgi:hypothetical protein